VESLKERLAVLETRLTTPGEMIGNYPDLPFAIFWYRPGTEWALRDEVRLLAVRVREKTGKGVEVISLAELLWEAIDESVGVEALAEAERDVGFGRTQDTVHSILTRDRPLPELLSGRMADLSPDRHIVLLTRAAAFAPTIYQMSALLEQLAAQQVRVPTVLFYPGGRDGPTTLTFMELREREAMGNYFVPIY